MNKEPTLRPVPGRGSRPERTHGKIMNLSPFHHLSDEARLWIYGFTKALERDQVILLRETLSSFTACWSSHGTPVNSGFDISDDRFAIIAAESPNGISGCSIDECVRIFKHLRDAREMDGLDRSLIFYRNPLDEVCSVPFQAAQETLDQGLLTPETPVFDTTLEQLGELRSGRFERPLSESWHARLLSVTATG